MKRLLEILDGFIMSDGSLVLEPSCKNVRYRQTSCKKSLLEYVQKLLPTPSKIAGPYKINNKYIYYSLSTLTSPIYTTMYKKWYKDRKKIIPNDLIINKNVLLGYYLGDGCLEQGKINTSIVHLATYGFEKQDVIKFGKKLIELGWSIKIGHRNAIRFHFGSSKEFLNFIGKCPQELVEDYGYKWNYKESKFGKNYSRPGEINGRAKLFDQDIKKIRNIYKKYTQLELSKQFGVHQTAISRIV
jgi:hypothetical protein